MTKYLYTAIVRDKEIEEDKPEPDPPQHSRAQVAVDGYSPQPAHQRNKPATPKAYAPDVPCCRFIRSQPNYYVFARCNPR